MGWTIEFSINDHKAYI
jgi:hypothetical protein